MLGHFSTLCREVLMWCLLTDTLEAHHVYSTLKRRENDVETTVSMWNTREEETKY